MPPSSGRADLEHIGSTDTMVALMRLRDHSHDATETAECHLMLDSACVAPQPAEECRGGPTKFCAARLRDEQAAGLAMDAEWRRRESHEHAKAGNVNFVTKNLATAFADPSNTTLSSFASLQASASMVAGVLSDAAGQLGLPSVAAPAENAASADPAGAMASPPASIRRREVPFAPFLAASALGYVFLHRQVWGFIMRLLLGE